MRDADGSIERLLAGLRDAEPPAGIERRILEALDGMEARETVTSASLWRPAITLLLSCAVILMVALMWQHRKHLPGQALVPLKPTQGLNGAPNIFSSLGVGQRPERAPADQRVRPNSAGVRQSPHVAVKRPHDVPPAGETQAASFPAPPLPLTEQERLLLRLAHRGDPENMAILNPDVRAAQTAKAMEQFQQFFEINTTEMRSESE